MPRSRIYLPKLESPPATIVGHLAQLFPQVSAAAWRDRAARGLVTTGDGIKIREDSPYTYGLTIFYMKEVQSEPAPLETETILFQDDEILAADKPHGMTVTPAGDHVARSMLHRLQERTGLETLVPLHRIDRDTAGLVLFGIRAASRARYHELFAKKAIQREYLAAAHVADVPDQKHWSVENRLGAGTPWFRRQILKEGPINASTEIELIEVREDIGLFRLKPATGKKHQLRVHMASIGFPILGDALYPEMRNQEPSDPPMQLLACRLTFIDPVSGIQREFNSERRLQHALSAD